MIMSSMRGMLSRCPYLIESIRASGFSQPFQSFFEAQFILVKDCTIAQLGIKSINTCFIYRTIELKDNTTVIVFGASGDLAKKKTVSCSHGKIEAEAN
jgi:hypothetical protein